MELKETIELMQSGDYRERFKAEYLQTKIRHEKLKLFNAKIEAARRTLCCDLSLDPLNNHVVKVEEPKHDCPRELLCDQQRVMGEYLHLLEVRAVIEGIDLVHIHETGECRAKTE